MIAQLLACFLLMWIIEKIVERLMFGSFSEKPEKIKKELRQKTARILPDSAGQ